MTSLNSALHASTPISEILAELLRRKREYENAKVRIAIIGESGAGKSSLINAICGRYLAEVGVVETTSEPQEFAVPGTPVMYVDLPGAGTVKWPTETYVSDLNLLSDYDAYIFANRGRISESDVAIYRALREDGRHVFIARNFFDGAVHGERGRPEGKRRSRGELRDIIVRDFRQQFDDPQAQVFVVASLPDQRTFELPELIDAIHRALSLISEAKAMRFLEGSKAYTHEMLEQKTKAARKLVHLCAAAMAAGSAIPIPALGVVADATTLTAMTEAIARTFNIDIEEKKLSEEEPLKQALKSLEKYVTREGVIALLRPMVRVTVAKEASKYIPVLGTAVSATAGAAMMEILGLKVVREFRDVSEKILEAGL